MNSNRIVLSASCRWRALRTGALPALLLLPVFLAAQVPEIALTSGLVISESSRIRPAAYALNGSTDDLFLAKPAAIGAARPVIVIRGDNITVDFQRAELRGSNDKSLPNEYYGLGILVQGRNVTIRNARARGYKVALLADGVENLTLENCDFSYNYRPRLRSIREREDFSDWLSYHQNEQDEWLRYGAGMYLKNCAKPTVKGCRVTGNQNALLMTGCTDGLVYNNRFHFNSGLGIGLYRSSRNRVMHNRLDWNVRGYSHGFYERGQDSAGILVYEQSSNNLFAFNSATHSGDGFFLWAGQSTMDTGEGGCNDNLIFGNDFSHAPTNGVEVTFSRNTIAGNYITDCTHGIWGGYSYGTNIFGNLIANCRTAIAIEHGQNDTIRQNLFEEDSIGIHLWARAEQPGDWAYAKKRDTRSRDNLIDRNVFLHVRRPLKIAGSQNVAVNGLNLFFDFTKLLETPQPNEKLTFVRNDVYGTYAQTDAVWAIPALAGSKNVNSTHNQEPSNPYAPLEVLVSELREPDSLPDGMLAALPPDHPRGRQYIIVDEWGPYDFRRPVAVLKNLWTRGGREMYRLQLLGPSGNWRTTKQEGIQNLVGTYGQMPAEVTFERAAGAAEVRLEFEFTSIDTITTVLGQPVPPREPYRFAFERFEKKLDWQVMFYNYTDATDPLLVPNAFATLRQQRPVLVKPAGELYFAWWGKPAEGVQEDKFATISRASFDIEPGEYRLELTSDDGARLYLDGKRLIDNWDVHEPETDEVTVTLGGRHTVEVEHFEAGGFSTLDFRIKKVR